MSDQETTPLADYSLWYGETPEVEPDGSITWRPIYYEVRNSALGVSLFAATRGAGPENYFPVPDPTSEEREMATEEVRELLTHQLPPVIVGRLLRRGFR